MAAAWYVMRTQSRAEYVAADELRRDGFEVLFPRVESPNNPKGHGDTPLFPGYLFLRCDLQNDNWPSFRPAHRVLGWVTFGGEIPSLPDSVVSELTEHLDKINNQGGLWHRFQAGETVQINSGTIQSLAEVLEDAKSPHSRVKVLLQFMGRQIQAQVPWENIQPIIGRPGFNQRAPRRTRGRGRRIKGFEPSVALAN